jgi:hypothetical protein
VVVTPAIAKLHAEAVELQADALAESTQGKYAQHELYWVRFLVVFGLMAFMCNPSEGVLKLYVSFLALSAQYGSVRNYLKGLQRFLKARSWTGHMSDFWSLQQVLAGLRRRAAEVVRKLPITPFILGQIFAVLAQDSDMEVMMFTAMLVAFGAFLRKANVCAASESISHVQRALLRRDVVLDLKNYCLHVTLRFRKNAQYGEAAHKVVVAGCRGHMLDPVAWWCSYTQRVPAAESDAAFGYMEQGKYVPLTHSVFVRWVKLLISRAGLDAAGYSGHSFRRGAATFSFLVGLPEFLIKEMGAWRSQVYQVYLDLSLPQRLEVHQKWFAAMAEGQWGADITSPAA